jgi:hypothetical protein
MPCSSVRSVTTARMFDTHGCAAPGHRRPVSEQPVAVGLRGHTPRAGEGLEPHSIVGRLSRCRTERSPPWPAPRRSLCPPSGPALKRKRKLDSFGRKLRRSSFLDHPTRALRVQEWNTRARARGRFGRHLSHYRRPCLGAWTHRQAVSKGNSSTRVRRLSALFLASRAPLPTDARFRLPRLGRHGLRLPRRLERTESLRMSQVSRSVQDVYARAERGPKDTATREARACRCPTRSPV